MSKIRDTTFFFIIVDIIYYKLMIEMTLFLFGFVTNTIFIEHQSRQIISITVKKKV